jgi:hypothetical protein
MPNVSFLELLALTQVQHVATEESDHMALLIKVAAEADSRPHQRTRGFMFEEMWTKHPEYDRMLSDAWKNSSYLGSGATGLCLRLKEVSADFKRWIFNTFGSVQNDMKKLRAALEEAKTQSLFSGSSLEVRNIEKRLHKCMSQRKSCIDSALGRSGSKMMTKTPSSFRTERRTSDGKRQFVF